MNFNLSNDTAGNNNQERKDRSFFLIFARYN